MDSTVVAVFGVDPFRIGGVETYTRELARQLAERNVKLVAIFSRLPRGKVAEFLTAPNLILEELPELETSMLASLRPLASALRRHRARILHFQFVSFVGGFPWVARLCGVKQVFFTAQSSRPGNFQLRRARVWKRLAVRLINAPLSRVFCISEYNRQAISGQDLLPSGRFEVLYNAIPPVDLSRAAEQAARFRQRFHIPADRCLVTQVSWIIPEKGIPQLLEAARLVLAERPNTHFAIVGTGVHEAEYQRKAEEMGIAEAITWTGLLENPLEDGVYGATDVFCLASQWQEAFGWVIAEAMAFGKPVVATAVGGIPEVVTDGETGLLVRPAEDSQQLARHILQLLADAGLRERMGAAGQQAVEQKFHLSRNVTQVISHYAL